MKIIEFDSEEQWLEARREYITATMAAKLMRGPAGHAQVRKERAGQSTFVGGRAVEWGKERESDIAEYLSVFVDSRLRPNAGLVVSASDERFAATPDMLTLDGELIAEIKTTSRPFMGIADAPPSYWWQIQWQLLVTGAEACVFAWEYHEDYVPMGIDHEVVRPDDAAQGQLLDVVRGFLDGPTETGISELVGLYRGVMEEIGELQLVADDLKSRMLDELGDGGKWASDTASVAVVSPRPSRRFDQNRFKADHPDMADEYTRLVEPKSGPSVRVTLKDVA